MKNQEVDFEIAKEKCELMYVAFGDTWCSACKDLSYILNDILKAGIPVYNVNISENVDLMKKYSISSIPTVIVFKKGVISDFIVGVHSKRRYIRHMDP